MTRDEGSPAASPPALLLELDAWALVWPSDVLIAATLDDESLLLETNAAFRRLAGDDLLGDRIGAHVAPAQEAAFGRWLSGSSGMWRSRTWGMLPDAMGLPRDYRVWAVRPAAGGYVIVGEPLVVEDVAAALRGVNDSLVTDYRRLAQDRAALDRAAREDPLTGVANRRAFDGRIARDVERGVPFSVVILDIDRFKRVNDRYGHLVGDAVLRWFGAHLVANARRDDLVARYGGEEFVVILSGTTGAHAVHWAERLRRSMAAEMPPGVEEPVTASSGVASWMGDETARALLERADKALYAAKVAGRDRVVAAEP